MIKNKVFPVIASLALVVSIISALTGGREVAVAPTAETKPASTLGNLVQTVRVILGGGVLVTPNPLEGGLVLGGLRATTSVTTSTVLPASDIVSFSTLSYTSHRPNVALVLPASTTFPQSFLPRAGDRTRIVFLNSTTTTGSNSLVGFIGGTGTIVHVASTTLGQVATASTTGQTSATIDIIRKPNTDLLFDITPYRAI